MSVTVTISASASALRFCTDQDPRQRAGGEVIRSENGNGQACPWAMGIDVPATAPARVPGLALESSTSALGDDARGLGRHMLG
ncbi:hypothetical protein CABS01_00150 [Colletotrichum abscissum]|uniref:Uncharacterized protein n=3 Tax=Colletotrichum acutatum species complex TaxID=2707335 RepID=A0A9P9XB23_9PEZI|nr:uncharacterized protein CLUP02_03504 [Colletotrichum lupini]XP_060387672.1 uncharacterized protein CTAM01_02099 [Colletotrichum tamarilloi]XP_060406047.1 uncharacterized protein CABS01_00150 [Colletotrichum abscissum]KAI3547212.1 hypothetical protein CABS02_08739 [Colletotrichum abscissum]KAK1509976.1 hypothetical protein CTAM01_02099 [Colletotrichum tamarilloi]KAK1525061.1 hypothetical protein CABS01_00150 [Colletotrichum abscissum]UQC78030.1 hypothetical protein CLUP02_03504 [Colletotric